MNINELNTNEIAEVNGGVAFLLPAILYGAGYIGALQVAADIGAGLGAGFYDATH
jgi:hypothetical protein